MRNSREHSSTEEDPLWGFDYWGFDYWGFDYWGFDYWGFDYWGLESKHGTRRCYAGQGVNGRFTLFAVVRRRILRLMGLDN